MILVKLLKFQKLEANQSTTIDFPHLVPHRCGSASNRCLANDSLSVARGFLGAWSGQSMAESFFLHRKFCPTKMNLRYFRWQQMLSDIDLKTYIYIYAFDECQFFCSIVPCTLSLPIGKIKHVFHLPLPCTLPPPILLTCLNLKLKSSPNLFPASHVLQKDDAQLWLRHRVASGSRTWTACDEVLRLLGAKSLMFKQGPNCYESSAAASCFQHCRWKDANDMLMTMNYHLCHVTFWKCIFQACYWPGKYAIRYKSKEVRGTPIISAYFLW